VRLDLADKRDRDKVELEARLEQLSLRHEEENRYLMREKQNLGDRLRAT
jgi:hypothetical protein